MQADEVANRDRGCQFCGSSTLCPPEDECEACFTRTIAGFLTSADAHVTWGDNGTLNPRSVRRFSQRVLKFVCINQDCLKPVHEVVAQVATKDVGCR